MEYIISEEELILLYMAGYFNGKTDYAKPDETVEGLLKSKQPVELVAEEEVDGRSYLKLNNYNIWDNFGEDKCNIKIYIEKVKE